MEEPTQFFLDALAEVTYDEDPSKALLGLDEWKVPESIFHEDGSCMSLWELARANGYRFEGKNDTFAGSIVEEAFVELGVDPVIGPATLDHLELGPGLPTPIVTDEVTTQSTCANQPATVYPLDTLQSLENTDLGPPLAVVQLTPATDAPITQVTTAITQRVPGIIEPAVRVIPTTDAADAPVTNVALGIIDPAVQVAPATDAPVTQVAAAVTQCAPGIIDPAVEVAPVPSDSATSVHKVFTMLQAKSRPHPAKQLPKQKAKRVPKQKQNDELHKIQKKTKAQTTPRKAKGKTTLSSVAPPLPKIAPAPMTPAPAPVARFTTPMTPVAGVTHNTTTYPSQQQLLQIQEHLRRQEQYLRTEWNQLQQQQDHLKQQQPGDEQQLQIHRQQCQLHQQQFKLCHQKINHHKQQVRRYRYYQHRQHQHATQQTQQFQTASTQQAVYPSPTKERMQSVLQGTQQLQTGATQQVYPTPPKDRMQSVMQQTQQLQASAAQRVQQPQRMQAVYSTPPKEPMQSVSSLSATSPSKRTFQFMENIVPANFVANPNIHARWGVSPNGDRTYLNGSPPKKARVSPK
ncbi:Ribonuclease P Rpp40 [Penicillium cf. griseofulvum]|nr:Ribonuclease P Rpp40 [Penicillium cf. griseofulvum]